MCVVEVKGKPSLVPSCSYPVEEGMEVYTRSPRVLNARRTIIELLLASHPFDCLTCPRNKNCELQDLAAEYNIENVPYKGKTRHHYIDFSSPASEATIEYLKSLEGWQDIYLVATPEVEKDFINRGFNIDSKKPNYVVFAYDLTFTFKKLDKASRYVRRGIPFIATHADNNWMIGPNDFRPDVGALAAAITASTKIKAKFIGKPNIETVNAFLRRLKVTKDKVAIVGDRLDTDIRMGYENDILSILVLSGKTQLNELENITVSTLICC